MAQRYGTIAAHTRRRASVLVVFAQFCRFDKADATADVQWHCNRRPPLWYHYFPAQSSLGANILVYWIGKIVRTCAPGGSRTLDSLHARRAPYPLGQALRSQLFWRWRLFLSMGMAAILVIWPGTNLKYYVPPFSQGSIWNLGSIHERKMFKEWTTTDEGRSAISQIQM